MTASASLSLLDRRAYRRREVCEAFGVSLGFVDRLVREGKIRTRKLGDRVLLLNAKDVHREMGFEEPEVSVETLAELGDLLA